MNKSSTLALALFCTVYLSACSQTPKKPSAAEIAKARPENAQITSTSNSSVAALQTLAKKADRLARSGAFEAAASTLERALRIESRSPGLWTRLANIRLEQGRYQQAEQLAKRSNSLATKDGFMQSVNWKLIAATRIYRGDTVGADSAMQQSERAKNSSN